MQTQETNLTLPDVRLHFLRVSPPPSADQPTFIFLHYFGGSSRTWLPVIERLCDDHPCVALDLRGSGESRVNPVVAETLSAYSLDLLAGDLPALIGELDCRRYVLVGHSMGGKVALAAATAHDCPPGLAALILLAPSPPTPEPMADAERARLLAGQGREPSIRKTLSEITAHPLPPEGLRTAIADQLRVVPAAWRAWLEYGNRQDISARLSRLKVPVFLATGEKDPNITAQLLRHTITSQLPPELARAPEIIPDAAHLLPLDAPDGVAGFIRRATASLSKK